MVLVAEEGDVDASETSILAGGRGPRKQTVLGVDGGEDDGGTTLLELFGSFGVRNDFGGTEELRLATGWRCGKNGEKNGNIPDESPGHGDEGQNEPLALVIRERDICKANCQPETWGNC